MFENLKWKLLERPVLPIGDTYLDAFVFLVFFGLLFFAGFALKNKKGIKFRPFIQSVSFAFFIFVVHRCFCALRETIFSFQDVGRNDLNVFNGLFILAPLVAFTLLSGRIFCGWLCPLGFVQEIFFRAPVTKKIMLGRSLAAKRLKVLEAAFFLLIASFFLFEFRPKTFFFVQNIAAFLGLLSLAITGAFVINPQADSRLKTFRFWLLWAWIILISFGVFVTDPWCALYGNEIDYSSLVGLFAVAASAIIVPMAWCRYLCPLGTCLGAITKFSQFKIKLKSKGSLSKETADQLCYVQALSEKGIDGSSCLFCKRCVQAEVSTLEESSV